MKDLYNINNKSIHMNTYYKRNKEKVIKQSMEYQQKHRALVNKQTTARRVKAVNKIFDHLGRICLFCGFKDNRALCFDHVHNDGSARRKEFGHATLEYLYYSKHLDEVNNVLQVLCYNCNIIKEKARRSALVTKI